MRVVSSVTFDGTTVVRPPLLQRAAWVAMGVGGAILFAGIGLRQDPWAALLALPAGLVGLTGLRSAVTISTVTGAVTVRSALRQVEVPAASIDSIRVPPWGPILLLIEDPSAGAPPRSSRQIKTGLYASRPTRASSPATHDVLAAALGVPVVSVWPQYRSAHRRQIEPQVSFGSLLTWNGAVTWFLTTMIAVLVGVILVGTLVSIW